MDKTKQTSRNLPSKHATIWIKKLFKHSRQNFLETQHNSVTRCSSRVLFNRLGPNTKKKKKDFKTELVKKDSLKLSLIWVHLSWPSHSLNCAQETEQKMYKFNVHDLQSSNRQNSDHSAKSWPPLQAYSNFINRN